MSIKAIETIYNGIRFRSRLEARWAIFMDALSVKWEYEPEGFTDGKLCYLPDFWLPELKCYLEVKPDLPTLEERNKAWLAVWHTGKELFFLIGRPTYRDACDCPIYAPFTGYEERLDFVFCQSCKKAIIVMTGTQDYMECCLDSTADRTKHNHAVFAANNYRFGGR